MALVGTAEISKALNVTPRRVLQLVADGTLKKTKGKFELVPCMTAYIKFLQHAVESRQSLTGRAANDGVRVARIALLEAQREKLVRQNLIASGEVVPLEVMRARLSTAIVTARAQLLNLPGRVAPQLEGETRLVIKEKLRAEIYAALAALAVNGNVNGSPPEPMDADTPHASSLFEH
jgi:hypothetical protein